MLKIISIEKLKSSLRIVWKRFPFAVSIWGITLLTTLIFLHISLDFREWSPVIVGETLAFLSSLLIEILYENRCIPHKTGIITCGIALSILYALYWSEHKTEASTTSVASIINLLIFSLIFFPYCRKADDASEWHYSMRQISNLIEATVIALILTIASSIIISATIILFRLNNDGIIGNIMVTSGIFVPAFYCVAKTPFLRYGRVSGFVTENLLSKFSLYILVPAVLVYTTVLYIYGIKILTQWDLPRDSICMMVSGLLFFVLIAIYGLKHSSNRLAQVFSRTAPILMLPLAVMMSVAIGYRVSQYGLSNLRLYIIILNLWSYAVLISLILRPRLNMNKVAISFAAIFFLVSAIPGFNINVIKFEGKQNQRNEAIETTNAPFTRQTDNENALTVPVGTEKIEYITKYSTLTDDNIITIKCAISDDDLDFKIPVDSLKGLDSVKMSPVALHAINSHSYDFVLNYIWINPQYNSININGFVIKKNSEI